METSLRRRKPPAAQAETHAACGEILQNNLLKSAVYTSSNSKGIRTTQQSINELQHCLGAAESLSSKSLLFDILGRSSASHRRAAAELVCEQHKAATSPRDRKMTAKAVAAMGLKSRVANPQGGEAAAETEAAATGAASETAATAAISHLYGTVFKSSSQQSRRPDPMPLPLARTQDVSAAETGAASAASAAARAGVAPLKESDLAHSFISGLLMPDGITVRKPAPLGMASGDPVGTHILRKKATGSKSEKLFPASGSSGLNLSMHRRAAHSLSWQQRSFRSTTATAAPATGAAKEKTARRIFGRHLDLLESFPKLVAFSPSLSKALTRKSSLYSVSSGSCSSVSEPATEEGIFAVPPPADAVAAAAPVSSGEKRQQQELLKRNFSAEQGSAAAAAASVAGGESVAADAAKGSSVSTEIGEGDESADSASFARSPRSAADSAAVRGAQSPPRVSSESSEEASSSSSSLLLLASKAPAAGVAAVFRDAKEEPATAAVAAVAAEIETLTSAARSEEAAAEDSAVSPAEGGTGTVVASTVKCLSPSTSSHFTPQKEKERLQKQQQKQQEEEEAPTQYGAVVEGSESLQREISSCEEQLKHDPTNQKLLYKVGILLFRCGRAHDAIDIIADFLLRDAAAHVSSKVPRFSAALKHDSSNGRDRDASSEAGVKERRAATATTTTGLCGQECTAPVAAEDEAAAESARATTATRKDGVRKAAAASAVEKAGNFQRKADATCREAAAGLSPAGAVAAAQLPSGCSVAAESFERAVEDELLGVYASSERVLSVSHASAENLGVAAEACVKQEQDAASAAEESAALEFTEKTGSEKGEDAQLKLQQQVAVQQLQQTRTKSERQCPQKQQQQKQPLLSMELQLQQKVEEEQQKEKKEHQKPQQKEMRGSRQEQADYSQLVRTQGEETAKTSTKDASAAAPALTVKKEEAGAGTADGGAADSTKPAPFVGEAAVAEATQSTAKYSAAVEDTCLENSVAKKHTTTAAVTGVARQLVPVEQLFGLVLDKMGQIERRARDLLDGWGLPRHLELEKLLGHLFFEEEEYMEAIRHYWRCIDICPNDAQLFTNLGLTYYEVGSVKEATAAFEEAVKRDDRNVMALSTLAMLLMDDFLEKEEERRQEVEQEEEEMEANETTKAAEEEQRLQRLREGTKRCVLMLKRCLEIEKDNILVQLHLAQVFMCREEWTECERIFHALLLENPNDTHLLNNLGQIAFSKGETETALNFFERVLRINPEDELGHLHMCEVFCKLNDPARALQHFRLCCEASPDSVSLHATCGLPLCEIGKEKEIVAAYTNFIKKFPKSVAARTFRRSLGLESENVSFYESSSIIIFIVLFISFWTSPEESAASSWEESFYARYPSLAKKIE